MSSKRPGRASAAQQTFDFTTREPAKVIRLADRVPRGVAGADSWYEAGCEREGGSPELAAEAYRRALAADPAHYGANLNLGRLLHEAGRPADAEALYRTALSSQPGDATALFNLGVALEDQGREVEALRAYEDSLAADPRCADARHNAARLAERLGRPRDAVRLLGAALRLAKR